MIDKDITERLKSLSIDQLDKLKASLDHKIKENNEACKKALKAPPLNSNDLNTLAEMAGLDISSLLREIGKGR